MTVGNALPLMMKVDAALRRRTIGHRIKQHTTDPPSTEAKLCEHPRPRTRHGGIDYHMAYLVHVDERPQRRRRGRRVVKHLDHAWLRFERCRNITIDVTLRHVEIK